MGLIKIQQTLARLYTDTRLREQFFSDPAGVCELLGLDSEEFEQLAQLSRKQMDLFADSLQQKRLNEVEKMLPLTRRALGKEFARLFLEFAESFIPKGIKKHREDAIAFTLFIKQGVRAGRIAEWIVDLARYESGHLEATDPNRWAVLRLFRYPIRRIVKALLQGDQITSPPRIWSIALWHRLPQQSQVKHLIL
jgi:hypothetical protein